MARHISNFLPGQADMKATPSWCELLITGMNCQPMSHTSETYGNHCGRFCLPYGQLGMVGADSEARMKCSNHAMWMRYRLMAPGGDGWGSCCCMWGPPGGPGAAVEGCLQVQQGSGYCYTAATGGCCYPSSVYNTCRTCFFDFRTCCVAHVCGGYCGPSSCYYWYCCHDQTSGMCQPQRFHGGGAAYEFCRSPYVNSTSWDSASGRAGQAANDAAGTGSCFKVTCGTSTAGTCKPNGMFMDGCMCHPTLHFSTCNCDQYEPTRPGVCGYMMGYEHGYQPAMAGMRAQREIHDKNIIPYGGHCFHEIQGASRASHWNKYGKKGGAGGTGYQKNKYRGGRAEPWTGVARSCVTGCCAADAECSHKLCTDGVWQLGYMHHDWCSNYQNGICSSKPYTALNSGQSGRGMGHGVTGPRWVNYPLHQDGMTSWGGWNWTYNLYCALGTADGKCGGQNWHALGFGGIPPFVCGGGCCCSGQNGDGGIQIRYRAY